MATAYLPPVQYFFQFIQHPTVVMEGCEHYQKGAYRSRCCIATANGVTYLTIPLIGGKHAQTAIREVKIDNQQGWQRQHWRTIQAAYGSAPFFDYYAEQLYPFYHQSFKFLYDYNMAITRWCLQTIGLPDSFQETTEYQKMFDTNTIDFRQIISPKFLIATQDAYFYPTPYAQVFEYRHGFLPNLSIIDVLMCQGVHTLDYLKSCQNKAM
ncbi:MAG: WbqC family protein [Saprospiraceae bacterium]|nr:WbqC family protein [Saprospiraceae bacterium]